MEAFIRHKRTTIRFQMHISKLYVGLVILDCVYVEFKLTLVTHATPIMINWDFSWRSSVASKSASITSHKSQLSSGYQQLLCPERKNSRSWLRGDDGDSVWRYPDAGLNCSHVSSKRIYHCISWRWNALCRQHSVSSSLKQDNGHRRLPRVREQVVAVDDE